MTCDVRLPQGCSFRRVSLHKARLGDKIRGSHQTNSPTTSTTSQNGKKPLSDTALLPPYTLTPPPIGRQTPHTAAARGPAEQIHRHWARRHHKARVDFQHYARLIRFIPRPPEHAALHERGYGHERGSCAPPLHGKHGTAGWTAARDGGRVREGRHCREHQCS